MAGLYGSTAIGFKYKTGILVATDMGASYGSLAVPDVSKIYKLTDSCLAAFSGNISDIQYLHRIVDAEIQNDPRPIDPQGIHKMIQRIVYERRSQLKILDVSVLVCGINKKENKVFASTDATGKMIGVVNSKGNFWFDSCVATGIASHLILPVLRERKTEELGKEEATALMEECLRILCYKDCRASNIMQLAFCEDNEAVIADPQPLDTNWSIGAREDEIVL